MLRSIAIAMVLPIIVCASIALATPAEDAFREGTDLADKRNYQAAVIALDKAIKLNPKYTEAYNNRGLSFYSLGQYQKAIDDCTKAIGLDPRCAAAYDNRACLSIPWGSTRTQLMITLKPSVSTPSVLRLIAIVAGCTPSYRPAPEGN